MGKEGLGWGDPVARAPSASVPAARTEELVLYWTRTQLKRIVETRVRGSNFAAAAAILSTLRQMGNCTLARRECDVRDQRVRFRGPEPYRITSPNGTYEGPVLVPVFPTKLLRDHNKRITSILMVGFRAIRGRKYQFRMQKVRGF